MRLKLIHWILQNKEKYNMKNITDMLTEAFNQKKWEDAGRPVMYSIYGSVEGPWYFGYTDQSIEMGQMKVFGAGGTMHSFAKMVVPFDQFDAYKLANNTKHNLVK